MGISSLNIVLESGHRIVATEARLGRIFRTAPSLSLVSPGWLAGWLDGCKARPLSVYYDAGPGPVRPTGLHTLSLLWMNIFKSSVRIFSHPSVPRFCRPIRPRILSSIRSKILSLHPSEHPLIHPSEDSGIPSVQRFFHPSGLHNLVIHCTLCCWMNDNHGVPHARSYHPRKILLTMRCEREEFLTPIPWEGSEPCTICKHNFPLHS